jgi:hypothetical protein
MKSKGIFATAASLFALALVFLPNAKAECGGYDKPLAHPSSWQTQHGPALLLRTALDDDHGFGDVSIVGFWHVKFTSDGVTSGIPGGIPKGAPVDAGYSEWHSDGTEIMNSGGRAPSTSSFCLGVWQQVGPRQYLLNHFAASWDPTPSADFPNGQLIGPTSIRELVTLAPNGQSFTGIFTIDNYDESNNLKSHLQGTIAGTRITVSTPPSSIF